MRVGSLFSGIGGFDLGLERAGFTIEWQVEINDYCRRVLQKHWPAVPCHYDITTIDWRFIPKVDLVCGGFPCQPFSCAGKQRGKDDDRYLWPEVVRCLQELRPTWFLGENVPGLLHLGIEQVLADLATLGYETQILGIPACGVDAPHIRQRLWILSYSAGVRCKSDSRMDNGKHARPQAASPYTSASGDALAHSEGGESWEPSEWEGWEDFARGSLNCGGNENTRREAVADPARDEQGRQEQWPIGERAGECGESIALANTDRNGSKSRRTQCERQQRQIAPFGNGSNVSNTVRGPGVERQSQRQTQTRISVTDQEQRRDWLPEPAVGRVAHGIPYRVDRLKGLGNAIVPQIAEALGRMILEADKERQCQPSTMTR